MSCNIHTFVEGFCKETGVGTFKRNRLNTHRSLMFAPFSAQNYSVYSFLAGVRSDGSVPSLVPPRGLPIGLSEEVEEEFSLFGKGSHSQSWVTVKELLDFDYEQLLPDGETTYLRRLPQSFFADLSELHKMGKPDSVRVVFWFDN